MSHRPYGSHAHGQKGYGPSGDLEGPKTHIFHRQPARWRGSTGDFKGSRLKKCQNPGCIRLRSYSVAYCEQCQEKLDLIRTDQAVKKKHVFGK